MRTFPVQPPGSESGGFTFIEVLVALVITSVLVYVVSATLIVCLKGEDLAMQVEKSRVTMNRFICHAELGLDLDIFARTVASAWEAQKTRQYDGQTPSKSWEVWTISPRDRPSLRTSFAIRTP